MKFALFVSFVASCYAIVCSTSEVKIGSPGALYDNVQNVLWQGACGYPLEWCSGIHRELTLATFSVNDWDTGMVLQTIGTYDLRLSPSAYKFCFSYPNITNSTFVYISATTGNVTYTSLPEKSEVRYTIPNVTNPGYQTVVTKGQWFSIQFGYDSDAPANAMTFNLELLNSYGTRIWLANPSTSTTVGLSIIGKEYWWRPNLRMEHGNTWYLKVRLNHGPTLVNQMIGVSEQFIITCSLDDCVMDTSPSPAMTAALTTVVPVPVTRAPSPMPSNGARNFVF
jgi:hypothetical protein